jgi:hypothetical protein
MRQPYKQPLLSLVISILYVIVNLLSGLTDCDCELVSEI